MARKVSKMWVEKGGKLEKMVETNMVWLDLGGLGRKQFVELGNEEGVLLMGGRLVVHYRELKLLRVFESFWRQVRFFKSFQSFFPIAHTELSLTLARNY